jgi:hypothetical protein
VIAQWDYGYGLLSTGCGVQFGYERCHCAFGITLSNALRTAAMYSAGITDLQNMTDVQSLAKNYTVVGEISITLIEGF